MPAQRRRTDETPIPQEHDLMIFLNFIILCPGCLMLDRLEVRFWYEYLTLLGYSSDAESLL
ncbi:MAG: hypothetical protein HC769_33125 [Cyanobacteria bacterium CRU_2_1]|nr:hypothetical protein [Cyanobacteria bacterium RU_5_0]NJR63201.1 hypothetical protein [Cyanobacteria bacterium CRU_2_1]